MEKLLYDIKEKEALVDVSRYVDACVDVPKFLAFCKECNSYGHIWSCPPFDFEPMDIWQRYSKIRLYARILTPRNADGEEAAALEALAAEKVLYYNILMGWEQETPGSLALAAGSCHICKNCARCQGLQCRFPDKMRHSIESLGGDVGKTAELYFGEKLLWIKDGKLPEHLMLVGALLMK